MRQLEIKVMNIINSLCNYEDCTNLYLSVWPSFVVVFELLQRSPTDCGASLYVIKKHRKRGG